MGQVTVLLPGHCSVMLGIDHPIFHPDQLAFPPSPTICPNQTCPKTTAVRAWSPR
ncbi:hypothetical protein GDO86_002081 [Hymenochirus boettgeri]|uniref:Uncharacterized protein n=1 Tax=Hymenochirus boettgeri TaxID=247094 RepID=A0A8T2KLC5_9PIPI|nr:hypothetical protein GDO86_002081 [Hymenochirus boettgeri]KAG8456147.1 hypothetical protein GDO86_002081 [Hymenochirus boettgeri]